MGTTVSERLGQLKRAYDHLNMVYTDTLELLADARGRAAMLKRENDALQAWALWTAERIAYLEQER